jgi:hypothetical protein
MITKNYLNIFSPSDSHIRGLSGPHLLPLLKTSISNQQFTTKVLPPITTYDPVNDRSQEIVRPPLVGSQVNQYPAYYSQQLRERGYRKQQGTFETYAEIMVKNSDLVKQRKKP